LKLTDLVVDDGVDDENDDGSFKVGDLNGDGVPDIVSFVPDFVTRFPIDPPSGGYRPDYVVRGHLEVRWGRGSVSNSAEAGVWFSGPRELPTAFEITSREFAQRAFFDDVDGNGAVDLIGPFVAGDEFEPPGYEHDALGLRWLVESGSTNGFAYHTVALDPFFLLSPTTRWSPPRSVGQRPNLMPWVPFDGDGDGSRRHAIWRVLGEEDTWQISRFPRPLTWVLSSVTQSRVDSRIAHSRRYRWGHLEDPELHTPSTDVRCVDADPAGGHAAGRTDCLRRGGPVVRESWIEFGSGPEEAPWTKERFRYEGALFDRFERRSLGFERRIVENLEAGTRTTFDYDPWTTLPSHGRPRLRAGVPLKTHTEVFQRTTDTALVEESSVFTRVVERQTETVASGNTYFVYPRVEITHEKTDGEETFTSSRDARRDARGLVRESKVTVGDEQVDSTMFEYDFFDFAYRATPREVNRTRCRVMRCSSTTEKLKWSSLTGAAEGPIVLLHRRVIGANSGENYDYFAYNEGWDELGHATRLRETVEGVADASRFTERTTHFDFGDHDAFAPTLVKDALGHKSQVTHHPVWGRPSQSIDPNGFRVDWLPAFVVHRPTGIRYTADIDELGRTTEVVARRGTAEQRNVWEYDSATYGIGLLHRSTSSDGVVEVLGYESGGLLRERTVEIDGRSYRTRIRQRGRDGRIERLDVPLGAGSARSIGYQYDNPGFLRAVEPYGSADPWWERVDVAADGQTTLERFHATSVATDHDPATGLVQEVAFQAGSTLLGRYGYDYDPEGRLAWREQRNWTGSPESLRREEFTYDARGQLEHVRLENAAGSLLQERSYTYDLLGNLQTAVRPAGTREYVRDPAYPHRTDRTTGHDPRDLTYDERGQVTSSGTATVTYDLFGRPTSITEPVSRGSRQFAYDAAGNLVRTSSSKGIAYRPDAVTEDVVGGSSYVLHRIGGENVSGVLIRNTGTSTDRMLSQVLVEPASAAMTLNETTVVENYSFDEWGSPRGADWTSTSVSSIGGTAGLVGFAGHLHAGVDALLTRFQHMGARLYDRDLGLMTSPDPITNPRRALDLNPFAYAWNDPLN
jgi:RHS repeat-associated protein